MNSVRAVALASLWAAAGAGASACVVRRTAPLPAPGARSVAELRVERRSGGTLTLQEVYVARDTLFGMRRMTSTTGALERTEPVAVPVADVARASRLRFSAGRTLGLLLGIAGMAAVGYLVALAAAFGDGDF